MPVLLVLAFVGVPLLELAVILQVGGTIGGWWTAALLILFSIVGAMLLKFEGRRAWAEFRRALGEGRWPGDEVAQGALIIVGGTLLVTPGFITDIVGFLLLLSPSRRLVAGQVRRRMEGAVIIGGVPGDARSRSDGRASRSDRGVERGRSAPDDGLPLDVEVVEIRREQPPDGRSTRATGGDGRDDGVTDDDVMDDDVEQERRTDGGDGRPFGR